MKEPRTVAVRGSYYLEGRDQISMFFLYYQTEIGPGKLRLV
jgi:hypothetical protein